MHKFTLPMKKSAALMLLLSLLLIAIEATSSWSLTSNAALVISIIFEIFLAGYLVFLIKAIREFTDELGTWGYFWRAGLVKLVSLLGAITLLATFVSALELGLIKYLILVYLTSLLLSHLTAWTFFSKNRKGQIIWLSNTFK